MLFGVPTLTLSLHYCRVWTTRVDGYCDYVSQRWYEFTGRTKDESLGNEYLKAVHPEDQQVVLAMVWPPAIDTSPQEGSSDLLCVLFNTLYLRFLLDTS